MVPGFVCSNFVLENWNVNVFLYISRHHGTQMLKWKAFTKLCSYYWTTVGQTALFPLSVVRMICLSPGVLVNGVDAENGLYNGFCRMDCVWRAVKKLLTRRRVGLAEGSVTECLCKLILSLSDARISAESNWNDFMIPQGIDHRCVHCRLALRTRRRRKQLQQHGMKHWKPHMDEQGQPSMFQEAVTESMAARTMRNFNDFESVLVSAGRAGGTCVRKRQTKKIEGVVGTTHNSFGS